MSKKKHTRKCKQRSLNDDDTVECIRIIMTVKHRVWSDFTQIQFANVKSADSVRDNMKLNQIGERSTGLDYLNFTDMSFIQTATATDKVAWTIMV